MNRISKSLILLSMIPFMAASCTTNTESSETSSTSIHKKTQEIRDITASELVSEMKIGWNLGNTLESTISKNNEIPENTKNAGEMP